MNLDKGNVRKIQENESIPYNLLLLADETKEAIDKYINLSEIFVLEKNDEFIGIYVLQPIDEENVEIKNIAVDEKFQGQGIGTYLLKDAEKRAKKEGFKILTIGTADAGKKQLYLYQKVGFEIYGKKKNFCIDNYPEPIFENGIQCIDMVMLKKQL